MSPLALALGIIYLLLPVAWLVSMFVKPKDPGSLIWLIRVLIALNMVLLSLVFKDQLNALVSFGLMVLTALWDRKPKTLKI